MISEVTLKTKLPEPLGSYFEAVNREDVDGMLTPFAANAVVTDEGKTRSGVLELHEWIERVIVWGFKQGNLPLARKLLEYGIDHLRLCQEFERWIEEGDNFRSHQ